MARQSKLKFRNFLKNIDIQYLLEFFKAQSIEFTPLETKKETERINHLEQFMEALTQGQVSSIEEVFLDIQNLGNEQGILSIFQIADEQKVSFANELENVENPYNQAFYTFLHQPEIFRQASILFYTIDLTSKVTRTGFKVVEAKDFDKSVRNVFLNFVIKGEAKSHELNEPFKTYEKLGVLHHG